MAAPGRSVWLFYSKVEKRLWAQHVCFSFYVQITLAALIATVSLKMYPFSQKILLGNLTDIVSVCLYSLLSFVLT